MKIHDVEQGTPEWSALRAGIPTASQFDRILTRSGKKSEQRDGYKMDLLAERALGRPLEPIKTLPMVNGSMSEADAVSYYEFQRDVTTERVGFITDDDERWGASPDRLVGDRGLLEIKCPEAGTHMGYLMRSGKAYDKYFVQCNGQLWIAERDYVSIMSYFPGLPEALHDTDRDEAYIRLLSEAVQEFSADLEAAWAQYVDSGCALPEKPRQVSTQRELVNALKESLRSLK